MGVRHSEITMLLLLLTPWVLFKIFASSLLPAVRLVLSFELAQGSIVNEISQGMFTAHAGACTDAQMTFPTGSAVACMCLSGDNSAVEAGAGGATSPPVVPVTSSTAICSGLPVPRDRAHPLSHGHQVTRDDLRRIDPGGGRAGSGSTQGSRPARRRGVEQAHARLSGSGAAIARAG